MMDLFKVINETRYSGRLREMRMRTNRRYRRLQMIDNQLNLTSLGNKYEYLKERHPKYVSMVDKYLNECGGLTLKHGDSNDLDYTKTHLWGAIFLD